MKTFSYILFFGLLCLLLLSLKPDRTLPVAVRQTLSEYGFFAGKLADQIPADGVVPYRLNTPLFSDYAEKLRFVKLPTGGTVPYNATEVLNFPVGTTLIKTFYYPNDFRDADKGRRLMETRLLIRETAGWKAVEYVWNDEQTEAVLDVAGDRKAITYTDAEGRIRQQEYIIPNLNQCKSCHNRSEVLMPIGPSARQLNGDLVYLSGAENQLSHWQKAGWLTDLPPLTDVPRAPVWNDPATGSLDARARIWLDINCAHCHRPDGPANTSGLNLSVHERSSTAWGVLKTPIAAGRGSGGRRYDIVPGRPDESILLYRMESTDPGVMMPEVARKVTHKEGIALVREWIRSLPNDTNKAH